MIRFALFVIIVTLGNQLDAQWHDRYWITGYDFWSGQSSDFGSTYLDFFEEPVFIFYNPVQKVDMKECCAIGSSFEGELLFYSNCMSVHSASHTAIPGLDMIAEGDFWTRWVDTNGETIGFPLAQGSIVLPIAQNKYMLIYSTADLRIDVHPAVSHVYTATIVYDTILSQPIMIEKDNIVIQDTLTWGKISVCRHANGKDWWVLVAENMSNTFYSIHVAENGE